MKKTIYFLRSILCATIASLFIFSCSDEVSTMKPEDVKGRATIQGNLFFSRGYQASNNEFSPYEEIPDEPAKEKLVIVEVPNSSYKEGSTGVQRFTTKSDIYGNFNITIPVSPDGCNATIKTEDFITSYSEAQYDFIENKYTFKTTDRSYKTVPVVVFIEQNDIFIRNIEYNPELNY